tara:strand:+ start:230 stop:484 length:255 start_codon:yes stop_codon:yes gene_type:complete
MKFSIDAAAVEKMARDVSWSKHVTGKSFEISVSQSGVVSFCVGEVGGVKRPRVVYDPAKKAATLRARITKDSLALSDLTIDGLG